MAAIARGEAIQRIHTRYAKEFKLEIVRLLKLDQKPPIKGIRFVMTQDLPLHYKVWIRCACVACLLFNRV